MHPMSREFASSMTNLNSFLNQHQIQELHHQMPSFDPTSSHEDFLEQFLSSVPSSAPTFPWPDEPLMTHQMINAKAVLMQQQQLLLSNSDVHSFKNSNNQGDDESFKAVFNGFNGSIGQTSNQTPQFNTPQGGGMPTMSQPAVSGSSGGGTAGQPRQRVRARRGQATDPHSIAERLRRERIAERMKGLQELVPNANKTDKASMLDEIIDYVKFLQLQVKVLSMSRLGGAAAVAPLVADMSSEGRNGNGTQTSPSNNNDGMTVTENQVAKLMEEDMGSAMQYLQGKGLCLMPISLATAISTSTGQTRNPLNTNGTTNNPLLNGDIVGPTSPNMSGLTVQSAKVVKPPSKT